MNFPRILLIGTILGLVTAFLMTAVAIIFDDGPFPDPRVHREELIAPGRAP